MTRPLNLDLSNPDAIRRAIARLHGMSCTTGLPMILRDGVLAGVWGLMGIAERDTAFPAAKLATLRKPAIILIGDDNDAASGLLAWRSGKHAGRSAATVMVHGVTTKAEHYHATIKAAALARRVLLVGTSSGHARAWGHFLVHPRRLLVQPPAGVQHPVPRTPGNLH